MMSKLTEKVSLPNGLILEIWDYSRLIAADTTKVELVIRINIHLEESYFVKPEHYTITKEIFGSEITYEYKKERTFVHNNETDSVFSELLEAFRKDSLPYLAHDDFPRRFALSKYHEIEKNPYKYQKPNMRKDTDEPTV